MNLNVDSREVQVLARDMLSSGGRLAPAVRASIQRGALQIKREWADNARQSSGSHARLYPASISYDLQGNAAFSSAVIGPDKDRPQGALGNLLEFGSAKNPAHDDGGRALLVEQGKLERALADIAEQAVFGGAL